MFLTNPSSLSFPSKPSLSFPPSPSNFRCRAAAGDLSAGPSSFPRWFQSLASAAGIAVGVRIGQESDRGTAAEGGVTARRGGGNDGLRVNAREKKWGRNGDSSLGDDNDALPLPMTYPDSSPVSPEEIDKIMEAPIIATEADIDPTAPVSGDGAGEEAGESS